MTTYSQPVALSSPHQLDSIDVTLVTSVATTSLDFSITLTSPTGTVLATGTIPDVSAVTGQVHVQLTPLISMGASTQYYVNATGTVSALYIADVSYGMLANDGDIVAQDPILYDGVAQSGKFMGVSFNGPPTPPAWIQLAGVVPSGGTTGQVLAKTSNDDYATIWADLP